MYLRKFHFYLFVKNYQISIRTITSFSPTPNLKIKFNQLFINNDFVDSASKTCFPTINPSTEQIIAEVAEGNANDVDLAVQAAKQAFAPNSQWRQLSSSKRANLITKLADLIERDANYIANLETLDNGKPFTSSIDDVGESIKILKYYAGWCDKINGETIQPNTRIQTIIKREPIGVVGQIIPWNYPLCLLAWKWGPALAAGCTVVMKPAEQTSLTALYAAALSREAGFPPGVINVIPGYGPTAGSAICCHQDIGKIGFTGSLKTGKIVMEASAKSNLKRVTLELGGKSPLVVCEDFNIEKAVEMAHFAVFENQGQSCCAGSRTFVHQKIYNEFVTQSKALAKSRKVGNPFLNGIQQGPQIDNNQFKKILNYIDIGKKESAVLECGGASIGDCGFFIKPTVFSNVTDCMTIAQEEIFGPVQIILKYSTLEEVIERANLTNYGLAAGILTNDINKALKFSNSVDSGTVWVNCYFAISAETPFGGFKESGFGRELGKDGLDNYLEKKTITIYYHK